MYAGEDESKFAQAAKDWESDEELMGNLFWDAA
jgi:hypothetical protein